MVSGSGNGALEGLDEVVVAAVVLVTGCSLRTG